MLMHGTNIAQQKVRTTTQLVLPHRARTRRTEKAAMQMKSKLTVRRSTYRLRYVPAVATRMSTCVTLVMIVNSLQLDISNQQPLDVSNMN